MSTSSAAERLDDRTLLLLRAWDLEMRAESEELRILLEALPREDVLEEPELGVLLLNSYMFTLATDQARQLERELRPVFEQRGNDRLHRRFIVFQGILQMRESAFARAETCFRRVEWMSGLAKDGFTLSFALTNLGAVDLLRFRGSEALAYYARALVLARAGQDSRIIAGIFFGTGMVYRDLEMYPESQRDFELARRYQRNAHELAYLDIEESLLLVEIGRAETASRLARRARAFFEDSGGWVGVADACRAIARIAAAAGDLDAALVELEYARSVFPRSDLLMDAELEEERAFVAALAGDDETRARSEERAASLYVSIDSAGRADRLRRRVAAARSPA